MSGCEYCREFAGQAQVQEPAELAELMQRLRAALADGRLIDPLPVRDTASWDSHSVDRRRSRSQDTVARPFRCTACRREYELTVDACNGSARMWRCVPEDGGAPGLRLSIRGISYPTMEASPRFPMEVELVRRLPGSDSAVYWLGVLGKPVRLVEDGFDCEVTHLVVTPRYYGHPILPGARGLAVNAGFVTDPSLMADTQFDFRKAAYGVVATCDVDDGRAIR